MVPEERLELSHSCEYTILSRARLPVPPLRLLAHNTRISPIL